MAKLKLISTPRKYHIGGLMKKKRDSVAKALELSLFRIKPSTHLLFVVML